tara:strand:- start:9 stop:497 length:489 start_codon:yes stop_codon:yes gene_type:complete
MGEFRCKECDRDFAGQQAFDDHNRSKHYTAPKVPMSRKVNKKYMWVFLVLVVIVSYFYFIPSVEAEPGKYDDFAQCLTDEGVKMYGAYWCSHCESQKKDFGDSFHLVDYVECSLPNNAGQTAKCKDAGIESYPTWQFGDGVYAAGVIEFERLAERTGCVLPE